MFKAIYLFHGENEFEMNKKIATIAKENDLTIRLLTDGMGFPEAIMNLNTPSLFEGNLLYVIKDESILKDDSAFDVLKTYIDNPSPFASLVLAFPKKIDMRKKIPKYLKKEGFETVFSLMKPRELEKWIKEYFWDKGYDITEDTRYFLIEALGDDQILLESEIEKICLYEPEDKTLKIDTIKDIITYSIKGNIFQMLDGLMEKNGSKMIQSLDALYKLKEPEVKIVFMVIREFRLLLLARWLVERGHTKDDIVKLLKVHPFVGGRLMTRARQYDFLVIKNYLNELYRLEEKIKTGKGDSKILLASTLMSFCK